MKDRFVLPMFRSEYSDLLQGEDELQDEALYVQSGSMKVPLYSLLQRYTVSIATVHSRRLVVSLSKTNSSDCKHLGTGCHLEGQRDKCSLNIWGTPLVYSYNCGV